MGLKNHRDKLQHSNKQKQTSQLEVDDMDELCTDDLVSVVSSDRSQWSEERQSSAGEEVSVETQQELWEHTLLDATSPDDVILAMEELVRLHSNGDLDRARWLLQRLQYLLNKKGRNSPLLLRSLLSSHVNQLMKVLESAVSTSSHSSASGDTELRKTELIDAVVAELLDVFVVSSSNVQNNGQINKVEESKEDLESSSPPQDSQEYVPETLEKNDVEVIESASEFAESKQEEYLETVESSLPQPPPSRRSDGASVNSKDEL
ncbi:hypothetical protein FHG87_011498 [Trinorchestia longiramus]|nr:hypothetical protein FHG87_011498 [Trinorchestia longiramus]